MKLSFLGANHEVTGSCHCLEACGKRILIDCGMVQGSDEYERQPLPITPSEVDCVLLTHAHIDHSGRLPLLAKFGFAGPVHATGATADLCRIMLRDSAHIQEFEAEWRNRKGKRAGRDEFQPLYEMEDAEAAIALFEEHSYHERFPVCEGVEACFIDVGHLLGSASIEVWVNEDGKETKIVFSGDIGNLNQPLIKDPEYITQADYVVMESTYGDRNHEPPPDFQASLAAIIQRTLDRGGNVVIPSFAVGRTQELLYFIRGIKERGLVAGHGNFPVYIDSPLAIEATNIFHDNIYGYFDAEAMELVDRGVNPIQFPGLKTAVTSDESRAINFDDTPKVIISASGMCEAGRIKHHLKHNLWRAESAVVFVGYQANGTLGRILLEGAKNVKLFGEEIEVRAEIVRLDGISGHADQNGLIRWLSAFSPKPKRVFVVHGEDAICTQFTESIKHEMKIDAVAPNFGAAFDLSANLQLDAGTPLAPRAVRQEGSRRPSSVFARLQAAGQRLLTVIRHNEGGTNKDLAKFADQINALCDKWDR